MKMFNPIRIKRNNVSTNNDKQSVEKPGLTFTAGSRNLWLQKRHSMKNIMVLVAVTSMFASCYKDVLHGDGTVVSAERKVSNFSGISVSGANNVFISYAPEVSVSVKGYDNLIPAYKTEVRDGKLYLHYDEHTIVRNDNIQVYITMPSFEALSLSGSSVINATGKFDNTGKLLVETSGSGDVNIEDIAAEAYTVHASGSSHIATLGVKANTATVDISGSSTVTLSVQDKLDVHISGSGKVSYKGEPATVDAAISGSGKVIKL